MLVGFLFLPILATLAIPYQLGNVQTTRCFGFKCLKSSPSSPSLTLLKIHKGNPGLGRSISTKRKGPPYWWQGPNNPFILVLQKRPLHLPNIKNLKPIDHPTNQRHSFDGKPLHTGSQIPSLSGKPQGSPHYEKQTSFSE
ncbi:hypothetical protein Avbf_03339 [Armadillidium vulgare]|nr:hypothetical protein Avbf_03339 [Armadillidium vulgare]